MVYDAYGITVYVDSGGPYTCSWTPYTASWYSTLEVTKPYDPDMYGPSGDMNG